MRPPAQRNFVGIVEQIRPFAFGGRPAPSPAPKSVYFAVENTQSPMEQSCQRRHEQNVRPLREVNRYRGDENIAFHKVPPRPSKIINPKPVHRILVRTFE